jgi:hypothetical protein
MLVPATQHAMVTMPNEQMIAHALPPCLGGFGEPNDFGLGAEILPPLVGLRGRGRATLYISPVG